MSILVIDVTALLDTGGALLCVVDALGIGVVARRTCEDAVATGVVNPTTWVGIDRTEGF